MDCTFKWIGGATWILQVGGMRIACDPVLCPLGTIQDYFWFKSKRIEAPVYDDRDFQDVDLWLITHKHEDHMDEPGILRIDPSSEIVTHPNAIGKLGKPRPKGVHVLRHGEKAELEIKGFSVVVEAVPAVHGVNPVSALAAGGVNGYWVTLEKDSESRSIYVTSDTVTKGKILGALRGRQVDLLIPNMGAAKKGSWFMTLTLSAKMMKQIKNILCPRITIPVHFGTFEHYVEPISEVEKWGDDTIKVLRPGETYPFEL